MKHIKEILEELEVEKYKILDDGSVEVYQDVITKKSHSIKKSRRLLISFRKVHGNFDCSSSLLESLKGCPEVITKDFNCSRNGISELIGCPKKVGGSFVCHSNRKLTHLYDSPQEVGKDYLVSNCNLISLTGIMEKVKGDLDVSSNSLKNITSIKEVGRNLNASDNYIVSIPPHLKVYGELDVSGNPIQPDDGLESSMWG